jgi:polar amino acid transport system permease protein
MSGFLPPGVAGPVLAQATTPQVGPVWDWSYAWHILPTLLGGLGVTVEATVLGSLLAMVLGLVLAIVRRVLIPVPWRNRRFAVLWLLANAVMRLFRWALLFVMQFIRSTPLLVQLFFLFYALPRIGPTIPAWRLGIIGLGVHYATYTAEVYRAGIEHVEQGQWEAATALNLPRWVTWTRVVLPQAVRTVVPPLGNYVIAMFKDAPVLYTITVIELLGHARALAGHDFRNVEPYTIAGILFLAVSIPTAILVRLVEKRLGRSPAAA